MTTRNDIDRNRRLTRPILMRRCPARPVQPLKPMHWTRWVLYALSSAAFVAVVAVMSLGLNMAASLPIAGTIAIVGVWLWHLASED